MRKLLPILLCILGVTAGGAAGLFLRPAPDPEAASAAGEHGETAVGGDTAAGGYEEEAPDLVYYRMNNQFIVPVMAGDRVGSLVVLSLSIELTGGSTDGVYPLEPKLRDAFLSVLFAHERAGGFDGIFTGSRRLDELRGSLRAAAQEILGTRAAQVLITEIVRQAV
ncbi:MAG: flagellar basal body-associated FliL family protein [Pseudomonadota bacterium]